MNPFSQVSPAQVRIAAALLRHVLSAVGAIGVFESEDDLYQILSAVVTLGAVGWSVWEKARRTADTPPPAAPAA